LRQVTISGWPIRIKSNVVITDKDGKVVTPAPLSTPVWTPGLRFYRLSQSSSDPYDAYRYLWLGLETLLDTICPKQPDEGERKWLLRAITDVGTRIDLSQFVPTKSTNPAAYIVGTQYDNIRCRLFHAKIAKPARHSSIPNPKKVAMAYEQLIRLWREIAERELSVRRGPSAVMTNSGFKMMCDNAFTNRLTMYFTDDPSPVSKHDTEVSPRGHLTFPFSTVTYLSETAPGRVSFVGSQFLADLKTIPAIHRICSKIAEALMTVWYSEEGLYLDSVDFIESHQTIRLINRDLPRLIFGQENS
jgi:hypothetical protein